MQTSANIRKRLLQSSRRDENGCWLWTKTKSRNGYGSFAYGGGKNARAHRVAYEAFVGPIPAGIDVCHKCDVRACINPFHLFLGTRSENIQDCIRKGRFSNANKRKGVAHPSAKLTDAKVRDILRRLAKGQSKKSLSAQFGVSQRVILLIARNEAWKHIPRAEAA